MEIFKKKFVFILLVLLISINSFGCYYSDDRDEAWRNDLTFLKDSLSLLHSGLFYKMSEQEFHDRIAAINSNVPFLTDDEIKVEFAELLAMIKDAHTRLILIDGKFSRTDNITSNQQFKTYPIRAYWFTDGLTVVGSTKEHDKTLGKKLIKIADTDISEISNILRPIISYSVEETLLMRNPEYILCPKILHYYGIIDDPDVATVFTFENADGTIFEHSLSPYDPLILSEEEMGELKQRLEDQYIENNVVSPLKYTSINDLWETALKDIDETNYPLYLKNPAYYWYEYLAEYKTVYLKINTIQDMKRKGFAIFYNEMIAFIDNNEVKKLIIDMRFNPGGNYFVVKDQIAKLGEHKINTEGKIYTIIGKNTFSAAIVACELLKERTNSIFVGEPVGDSLEMYMANFKVPLPNSKLDFVNTARGRIFPNKDWQLKPDIEIEMTSQDYLSGSDLILETVLSYE